MWLKLPYITTGARSPRRPQSTYNSISRCTKVRLRTRPSWTTKLCRDLDGYLMNISRAFGNSRWPSFWELSLVAEITECRRKFPNVWQWKPGWSTSAIVAIHPVSVTSAGQDGRSRAVVINHEKSAEVRATQFYNTFHSRRNIISNVNTNETTPYSHIIRVPIKCGLLSFTSQRFLCVCATLIADIIICWLVMADL